MTYLTHFNFIIGCIEGAREDYEDGEIIEAFNSLARARGKIAKLQVRIKSEISRELEEGSEG